MNDHVTKKALFADAAVRFLLVILLISSHCETAVY